MNRALACVLSRVCEQWDAYPCVLEPTLRMHWLGSESRRAAPGARGCCSWKIAQLCALLEYRARGEAPRGISLFPHITSGAYPELSLAVMGRA